jgi:hypothetical protein
LKANKKIEEDDYLKEHHPSNRPSMNPNATPFKPAPLYKNPIDLAVKVPLAPIQPLSTEQIQKMTVHTFQARTLGEYDGMMTAVACAEFALE